MTEATPQTALPKVLIVDDSRIVRVTLSKHLKGVYSIREEADGEAGWEALLVDEDIHILISDLTMPRLDGYGLLQRIRGSKLPRIRNLPVLLISGDENEEARERAKALGASDFIAKGIGTTELLARLASLSRLAETQNELEESREKQLKSAATGVYTRGFIAEQLGKLLSQSRRHSTPLSVVVIGVDQAVTLRAKHGDATADQLMRGVGQMLTEKIRKDDSLGQCSADAFVVLCPATPDAGAMVFSGRLLETFEQANIGLQGKRLPLTVSIGFASVPADDGIDAAEFLALAENRMQQAAKAGGNRIVGASGRESGLRLPGVDTALAMLRAGRGDELKPYVAQLAMHVLPLLDAAERVYALGLPMAEIQKRLNGRAQAEKDARLQGSSNGSAGSC